MDYEPKSLYCKICFSVNKIDYNDLLIVICKSIISYIILANITRVTRKIKKNFAFEEIFFLVLK